MVLRQYITRLLIIEPFRPNFVDCRPNDANYYIDWLLILNLLLHCHTPWFLSAVKPRLFDWVVTLIGYFHVVNCFNFNHISNSSSRIWFHIHLELILREDVNNYYQPITCTIDVHSSLLKKRIRKFLHDCILNDWQTVDNRIWSSSLNLLLHSVLFI